MNIQNVWNQATTIQGVDYERNISQSIDRDQVVDDNGAARYDAYIFWVDNCQLNFFADEIETFAETW